MKFTGDDGSPLRGLHGCAFMFCFSLMPFNVGDVDDCSKGKHVQVKLQYTFGYLWLCAQK